MQQLISKTWLGLTLLALLVSLYITFTDGFVFGKAYMFLIIAAVSGFLFKFKKNAGK